MSSNEELEQTNERMNRLEQKLDYLAYHHQGNRRCTNCE